MHHSTTKTPSLAWYCLIKCYIILYYLPTHMGFIRVHDNAPYIYEHNTTVKYACIGNEIILWLIVVRSGEITLNYFFLQYFFFHGFTYWVYWISFSFKLTLFLIKDETFYFVCLLRNNKFKHFFGIA